MRALRDARRGHRAVGRAHGARRAARSRRSGELVAVARAHARDAPGRRRRAPPCASQAGAVTQAVHEHCAPHGLTWPVDFASKGSSTVGGNIATNAGGVKVIRYGLTRQWVLGLQVVLASGEVLELGGRPREEQHGPRPAPALHRQRGDARRRHRGDAQARAPARAGSTCSSSRVDDLAGVVRLFRETRAAPFTLSAYEMFTAACLARVLAHRKLRDAARRSPRATTSSSSSRTPTTRRSRRGCSRSSSAALVQDGTLAQSGAEARDLWALREAISERLSATGFPHKNDIALPDRRARGVLRRARRRLRPPLPGLGGVPLRAHRRRQPARQRDEARRRWTRPPSSRA